MDNNERINCNCQYCGYNIAKIVYLKDVKIIKCIICEKCNKILHSEDLGYTGKPRPEWLTNAQCPYCKSYNTQKISITSKIGNVALFGIFAAGKVAKEWHCNTCKSDF